MLHPGASLTLTPVCSKIMTGKSSEAWSVMGAVNPTVMAPGDLARQHWGTWCRVKLPGYTEVLEPLRQGHKASRRGPAAPRQTPFSPRPLCSLCPYPHTLLADTTWLIRAPQSALCPSPLIRGTRPTILPPLKAAPAHLPKAQQPFLPFMA